VNELSPSFTRPFIASQVSPIGAVGKTTPEHVNTKSPRIHPGRRSILIRRFENLLVLDELAEQVKQGGSDPR
jgi:hypothetical protein